jgi:hypothetical protein
MSGRVKKGISAASLIEQAERSGGAYIVFSYMEKYFITQAKNEKDIIRGAVILHKSIPKSEWRIPREATTKQVFKYDEGRGYVREEIVDSHGRRTIDRYCTVKRYRAPIKTTVAQRKAGKKHRDTKSARSTD